MSGVEGGNIDIFRCVLKRRIPARRLLTDLLLLNLLLRILLLVPPPHENISAEFWWAAPPCWLRRNFPWQRTAHDHLFQFLDRYLVLFNARLGQHREI